ncbi:MAG TPA: metal-dependent hydrolase [Vicinamibacterales bacterium]|jgi:inner membrane protein
MDNICHTLVGAAFGEAGLKRRTRFGAAALMISANLPDVDVLVFATGTPPVSFRRGITHGVVAQLLLPLLLTAVFMLIGKLRPIDPADDSPPLRPGWLLLLSLAGVYSHVFLDLLNNYGVRLLTPFSWRWFYGDAVFIADPWLWLVLGVGIWLTRRQRAVTPARGALVFATCYIVLMIVSARAARDIVQRVWSESRGLTPVAVMVGPVPVTPFRREVIIDAGDHYETGAFSLSSMALTMFPERIPKNSDKPEVAAARASSPDVRAFLVWSRFPVWTLRPDERGTRVTVSDMRFAGGVRGFSQSVVVPRPGAPEPESEH